MLNPRNPHLFFIAFVCLIIFVGISASAIWLYSTHSKPDQAHPVLARVTPDPQSVTQSGTYTCSSGPLMVTGSNTMQPFVTAAARNVTRRCTNRHIRVEGGGSSLGIAQLESGAAGIADSDRLPLNSEPGLVDHPVAIALLGVIVNPDTGVTNLTTAQLQGIFTSVYTNWSQVGGANLPIIVFDSPHSSSVYQAFEQYVLGQHENLSSDLLPLATPIPERVAGTSGAIGYASLDLIPSGSNVRIITIDGNQATTTNVEHNLYPFWMIEHMFTKGRPTKLEQALIDYTNTPDTHIEANTYHFVLWMDMQPFMTTIEKHNAVPLPS